jgi:hypothetical protein
MIQVTFFNAFEVRFYLRKTKSSPLTVINTLFKAVNSGSYSSPPSELEEFIDPLISVLIQIYLFKIISRDLGRTSAVKIVFTDTLTLGFMQKVKT